MEKVSIIIPTYNRRDILLKTLNALNHQNYDLKNVEVLVIDDCSTLNPENDVLKLPTAYELRFFRMTENIGQGRVRNCGIQMAKGEYVFFIGDDTVPDENFIKEHMDVHTKSNGIAIAVLGKIHGADELRDEFMNYIEKIQFHYDTIRNTNDVKLHFYTSNISLKKSWLKNEEYSHAFKTYGLEDLEFGFRLEKKGLRVVYNPKAIVVHYHKYNFDQFCMRMFNVGKSAVIFSKLHPELKRKFIPKLSKLYKVASFILSRPFFEHINKKIYWYASFVHSYLRGMTEELIHVEKQ